MARTTGASRSELIRRAVRDRCGERTKAQRIAGIRASAGLWQQRDFIGAEYVEAIRSDSKERRQRLGLE